MSVDAKKLPPAENPGLVLMFEKDATLQALVSTWPNAYRSGAKKFEQIKKWAELTGLREIEVEKAWAKVFENGFCNRDGTVDPFAAKYLASMAMGRLPAAVRRVRPEAPKETEKGGAS